MNSFETKVPGKWVLCGEHVVLREGTAVAFPFPEGAIQLEFRAHGGQKLEIHPESLAAEIRSMLECFEEENSARQNLEGSLHLRSTIPMGAGLGSSAALSVALCEWQAELKNQDDAWVRKKARELEHRFHGRSSGLDVAVVQARQPVSFSMEKGPEALNLKKPLRVTFHDTGLRARTFSCIEQVDALYEQRPAQALEAESWMKKASRHAIAAFQSEQGHRNEFLRSIAESMTMAHQAFVGWGLVPPEAEKLRQKCLQEGALAARLTGAGNGGFVVALWPDSDV
jgi:mevalonate kinase